MQGREGKGNGKKLEGKEDCRGKKNPSSTLETVVLYSHLHCIVYHSNMDPVFPGLDIQPLRSFLCEGFLIPALSFSPPTKYEIDGPTVYS